MENLDIIWGAVIIGVTIYFFLKSKGVKKQLEEQKKDADAHREAWHGMQVESPLDDTDRAQTAQRASIATRNTSKRVHTEPSIVSSQSGAADKKSGLQTVMQQAGKAATQSAAQSSSPQKDQNVSILSEITEDFDLQKAVLYSEILKTKFDE